MNLKLNWKLPEIGVQELSAEAGKGSLARPWLHPSAVARHVLFLLQQMRGRYPEGEALFLNVPWHRRIGRVQIYFEKWIYLKLFDVH